MSPRSPNFLIVGVTKGGTTFLAKALSEHPDVFFSKPKEPFFFNAPRLSTVSFDKYLRDYFAPAGNQRWLGEGSTNYFHHRHAIRFIKRFLGVQTHILVCLRHPVERLFSHYLHDYKRGRVTGGEALGGEVFERYISRSLYGERLKIWRDGFPNLCVLYFDDLVADASGFYAQAADFLDLAPQDIEDSPVNEGLRLVWDGDFLTLKSPLATGRRLPRFPREDVEALGRRFFEDVELTMQLTDRDLSPWLALPDFELVSQKFASLAAVPR